MEALTEALKINYVSLFVIIITILLAIKFVTTLFEWFIDKLGLETKWMREKKKEHELLMQTAENLSKLQIRHEEDVCQSIKHDKEIKDDLDSFMSDMRESMNNYQNQINTFSENRTNDRNQSISIQKKLSDSISSLAEGADIRSKQIEILMSVDKEILADRINHKYKYYLNVLHGIPSDEVDEFISLHKAYKSVNGNHHGDAKYNYVMNNLPVLPVDVKLVYDEDNK